MKNVTMPKLPRRWYTLITLILGLLICGLLLRRIQGARDPTYKRVGPQHPSLHRNKLPRNYAKSLPRIQYKFPPETPAEQKDRLRKQSDVQEVFERCWKSYKKLAFGFDELKPITGTPDTTFGGWGATLVDSLDTLWIMGMKKDFELAVKAVSKINFSVSEQKTVNVFETTIRYLGGLLGAYDVSDGAYPELLTKAVELGDILYQAFDTPQRIPVSRWDWLIPGQQPADTVIVAELGSLTLEFTRLSQLTGDSKYYDAVYRIMLAFEMNQEETRMPGLWPTIIDAQKLTFSGTHFTIGGMSDSLYEYLPKQYILLGGLVPSYENMYKSAFKAMKRHLLFRPLAPDPADELKDNPSQPPQSVDVLFPGNVFLGSENRMVRELQGQHLSCFAGGMVALAAKTFLREEEDLPIAKRLVDGCIWAYSVFPLGIMPETFHLTPCPDAQSCLWNTTTWHTKLLTFHPPHPHDAIQTPQQLISTHRLPAGFTSISDRRYLLRPEAAESIFILYRITGAPYLRQAAWEIFNAIKAASWSEFGHASIRDVTVEPEDVAHDDLMESYWMAETLKYFYLIFADDGVVGLDDFVLYVCFFLSVHSFRFAFHYFPLSHFFAAEISLIACRPVFAEIRKLIHSDDRGRANRCMTCGI